MNILQIADYLNVSRQTVRRYRAATDVPEPAPPRPALSLLTPHLDYLRQQWEAGETNAAVLARALAAQGYHGGYRQVARWAQQQRLAAGTSQTSSRRLNAEVQHQLAE